MADVEAACRATASDLEHTVDFRRTHLQGVLIDSSHEAGGKAGGIVINPGCLHLHLY